MSKGEKKPSYLLSKKGRPVLIGVVIVIVIAVTLASVMVGALTPEPDRSEQRPQGGDGAGSVRVERDNIRPDITSDNLTDEQQMALESYNERAGEDGGLHPIPTAQNVRLVDIPTRNNDEAERPQRPSGLPAREADNALTYTPPPPRPRPAATPTRDQGSSRAELDEIKRRQDAALNMISGRERSASQVNIASVSFNRVAQPEEPEARPQRMLNIDTSEGGPRVVGANQNRACEYPAVKGGDVIYANNELALNSDYPGAPVKVTFLSGEIRGWTGMGSYATNEFGEKMMVRINRVIAPNGTAIRTDVSGFVLDPDTTLWAVASDIDRHLIYRYGGLGFAAVLRSFGTLAQSRAVRSQRSDDTTVVNEYREPDGKQVSWTVAGELGAALERGFANNINRPITIKLDRNEEVGVLFENTICLDNTELADNRQRRAQGVTDPVARSR